MDKDSRTVVDVSGGGGGWIALAMMYIMCIGEPDIIDALIQFLTNA